tara:strand:- start:94 stop:327 length:234 start_codon:yes stop_codon:yes gene_type:complete
MKTVRQIKMHLRNCIEDMKTLHGFSIEQIAKASDVSSPTVRSCINRPHAVKAETIEIVYRACVDMAQSLSTQEVTHA